MEMTADSVANLCVINDMLELTTLDCALRDKHFDTAAVLLRRNKSAPTIGELRKIAFTDNTQLFEVLLETCKYRCVDADRYRLFSEFHSELIIKNVNIPEVQHLMEKSLLELQYKWGCNGGSAATPQKESTSDDQRIADIYNYIELIFGGNDNYLNSFQSDNQLLFLVRNISKHIFQISQKKFRTIQKLFPLEEMVYCLNIFLLVHQQPEEYMLYRLLIDKQQILLYLAKFYDVIHYANAIQCKSILNCYLEISNNEAGLDMSDVKKAELYWKLQNLGVHYSKNQNFHKIIKDTLKNLSETQLIAIKDKVATNQLKCKNKKSDLVKEKIELCLKNCFNKDKSRYKNMLECYFETTYSEFNRKTIDGFIEYTLQRPIQSPFDELIFKLYNLLHNNLFSAAEISAVKMNVTKYMDLSNKIKNFQVKFSEKQFKKKLKKKFYQLKQWYSVNRILYYIEAVEDLDMSQPNLSRALAIQRTMHVIGEFIKATEETKNISKAMEEIIEELGPKHLINISKSIRNNFSHNYSPNRSTLMDEIIEDDLLSDLKCMKSLFVDVLRLEKSKLIRCFFNTILQYKEVSQFQSLSNYVEHVVFDINEISDQINQIFSTISKEFLERVLPSLKEDNQGQMVTKDEIIKLMSSFCLDAYQVNFFVFNFNQIQKLLEFQRDVNKIHSLIKAYIKNSIFAIDKYRFKYKIFYNNISMYLQQLDTFEAKELVRKIGDSFMFLNSLKKIKNSLDQEDNVMTLIYAKDHINEIFSKLKLTNIHDMPGYKKEREELNTVILSYFENIFAIDIKFNALRSFFSNLDILVDPIIWDDYEAKEVERLQKIFDNKLVTVKDLIEKYRSGSEVESKVKLFAFEMLMMEVTVILSSERIFTENRFILDEMVPILNGLNLRNYFAHGNVAYKILLPHSSHQFNEIIFLNAMHICQMQLKLYGRSTADLCLSNPLVKPHFDNSLLMIQQQNELYEAIRTLNTDMLNTSLENGAEIRGKENVFEIFLSEHFKLYTIFKAKKEILNDDKLNFLTKFLPLIPNYIQKEGMANCKLFEKHFIANILLETQELIQRGKYEPIESSILHKACSIGSIDTVRLICQNKFNINRLNKDSQTPLMVASAYGYTDIIKILLNYGAKVEMNKDKSILHAVANNDLESLKILFSKWSNRNVKWTINLYDILHVAVICNCDLGIIEFLLSNGSSILSTDISLNTILHQAAYYGNTNIMRYLLKHDLVSTEYKVNDKKIFLFSNNYFKNTPLMAVAESGHLRPLKLLMQKFIQVLEEKDIDISIMLRIALSRNNQVVANELAKKYTHLMKDNVLQNSIINYAIERQAVTMIKFLLKRGFVIDTNSSILLVTSILNADIFPIILEEYNKDLKFDLNSELDYRGNKGRLITMALHQSNNDVLKILIQNGVDVHYRNELTKNSVLHDYFLSRTGTVEMLHHLIACDCEINAQNVQGSSPLHEAVQFDHLKKVNILLENGALVELPDNFGRTPLHVACLIGHYNCVTILLNFGAHINAIDLFKKTPLHYACLSGQNKCQEILIRYGADDTLRDSSNNLPSDYSKKFIKTCKLLNINCSKRKTNNNDIMHKIFMRLISAPEQSIDIDKLSKQMFSDEML